jgi:hypothetical protein
MLIQGKYVSEWEEGDIHTHCTINTETFEIESLETVECDYQHLESERVDVSIKGIIVQLDAEEGFLTKHGISTLQKFLH